MTVTTSTRSVIGRGVAAAALLLACASAGSAAGPVASASDLKAAFLLNFVRFTEWPADAFGNGDRLVVCLMDDTGVAAAFQHLARGRTAGKREVEPRSIQKNGDFSACHVAYVSGLDDKRSEELVSTLKDSPVLTMSDDARFAERGGIANFFVENETMGFAVNMTALQRARLQISAKLLTLARIVRK
jgi:hypothetical protein